MNTRRERIEYVPLSQLGTHHSVLGVISARPAYQFIEGSQERIRAMEKKGTSVREVLSLSDVSDVEQVNLVAEELMAKCLASSSFHAYQRLFLILPAYKATMAVSAVVEAWQAGAFLRLESMRSGIGYGRSTSSISFLQVTSPLPPVKTFYIQHLADEYIGNLPFVLCLMKIRGKRLSRGKADSGSALDALTSAFEFDGGCSVPYADPVIQVGRVLVLWRPLNEHV